MEALSSTSACFNALLDESINKEIKDRGPGKGKACRQSVMLQISRGRCKQVSCYADLLYKVPQCFRRFFRSTSLSCCC